MLRIGSCFRSVCISDQYNRNEARGTYRVCLDEFATVRAFMIDWQSLGIDAEDGRGDGTERVRIRVGRDKPSIRSVYQDYSTKHWY